MSDISKIMNLDPMDFSSDQDLKTGIENIQKDFKYYLEEGLSEKEVQDIEGDNIKSMLEIVDSFKAENKPKSKPGEIIIGGVPKTKFKSDPKPVEKKTTTKKTTTRKAAPKEQNSSLELDKFMNLVNLDKIPNISNELKGDIEKLQKQISFLRSQDIDDSTIQDIEGKSIKLLTEKVGKLGSGITPGVEKQLEDISEKEEKKPTSITEIANKIDDIDKSILPKCKALRDKMKRKKDHLKKKELISDIKTFSDAPIQELDNMKVSQLKNIIIQDGTASMKKKHKVKSRKEKVLNTFENIVDKETQKTIDKVKEKQDLSPEHNKVIKDLREKLSKQTAKYLFDQAKAQEAKNREIVNKKIKELGYKI